MINDTKFFAGSLMIPHSYKDIFKKIHSNLINQNYRVICNTYRSKLNSSFQDDVPVLREFDHYSDSDFLRNTIFLKQALNFAKLGKTSIIEVKPLLLHYAENQLFAFFINSFFHFNNTSKGHGIKMIGDNYENIGLEFAKAGFFQRVVNTYTVLKHEWIFSPYKRTVNEEFEKLDLEFDFTKKPTITLQKLIELKDGSKPDPPGHIFDQFDFLFLFLASSLARYKPDMWHSIVGGEHGNEIAYFNQSFDRFDKLSARLIHVLFSIYYNADYLPLSHMDVDLDYDKYTVN